MKRFGFPILLLLIVGAMVGIFALGNRGDAPPSKKPDEKPRLGTQFPNQGQEHIQPGAEHAAYNSSPPTSGPHYPQPAPWGIKDQGIADETLIHNLEHGGIVINYQPDIGQAEIEQLEDIFRQLPKSGGFGSIKAILVPRSQNQKPISLTAWTYKLDLDRVDEAQIKQFYADHIDKGPELVP
ncbi:MAG TPA: DUF3105 domain-containing protein [Candidatus Saccharimonadales bacterium]|nr:DUF3105 domain-containing protein [Candidatus Saccharimonadales bacterium]